MLLKILHRGSVFNIKEKLISIQNSGTEHMNIALLQEQAKQQGNLPL